MRRLAWFLIGLSVMGSMSLVRSVWAQDVNSSSSNPQSSLTTGQTVPDTTAASATSTQTSTQQYDFGDFTSETLTTKAWLALEAKDYAAVDAFTTKCITLYEYKAVEQAASLSDFAPKEKAFNYWALNDVATSYFIRGKALLEQGKIPEAQEALRAVIEKFPYAQAWDPKGWFWKVAAAAKDKLDTIGTPYDFGNYTSETLTTKAWRALEEADFAGVELYTKKCLELYEAEAKKQQSQLTDFAPKERVFDYWALNDVATCYFIRGKAFLDQGKIAEAQEAFRVVVEQYPHAQAWDPQGWFWKVAVGASDKLSTIGTPYDFGDYTSQTLTTKAWEVLGKNDHRGVELYTKKCIEFYEEEARLQQMKLTDFAPKEKAFDYWALNDVATCYFILGESLMAQKRFPEAKAAFERIVKDFSYAQCWDPKGWFWKVAVAARGRLNKILAETGN